MKISKILVTLSLILIISLAYSQENEGTNKTEFTRKHFISSSLFILYNAVPDQTNPPDFFQLNFGCWLTEKDVVTIEAITWKYHEPLGIPYGPSFEDPDEEYPGYIREFGIGFGYQRFLWKDLYVSQHAIPLMRIYMDEDDNKIQNGFQLFCTSRVGYHVKLFGDNWFVEPSMAATFWPIKTNVPDSFEDLDDKWNSYFLFEPGLHFGYKF